MTTARSPDTANYKNPSLEKYFQCMVNNSKLTVQFTQSKLRKIISYDLEINLNSYNELLIDVSIEALVYYMQGWPGWNTEKLPSTVNSCDESYQEFKFYLKRKIECLYRREKEFIITSIDNCTSDNENSLNIPSWVLEKLPPENKDKKIVLPFSLEISGKLDVLSSLNFKTVNGLATLQWKPEKTIRKEFSLKSTLNHPYVSVSFVIPNMINFIRQNCHKIDMFLCTPTDFHQQMLPKMEHIVNVEKNPHRSNIYTFNFFEAFFSQLNATVENLNKVTASNKHEIKAICNELLADIKEANVQSETIQECTDVCYRIGGSVYYNDSAKNINDSINLRKYYIPQVLYNLKYCPFKSNDITNDGTFQCFMFKTSQQRQDFIKNFVISLTYSCTLCKTTFGSVFSLKSHLNQFHACTEIVKCSKCNRDGYLYDLMFNRWRHDCIGDFHSNNNITI